jgi:antitoxin (DNA-binding transcriptional repressor) of toxin-antitoxin stability system
MISVSVTDFARKLKTMLDLVEYRGEEIVLIRNKQSIAKITPGSPHLTALEAMSDLYRTLPENSAGDWVRESRIPGTLDEMKDPWE